MLGVSLNEPTLRSWMGKAQATPLAEGRSSQSIDWQQLRGRNLRPMLGTVRPLDHDFVRLRTEPAGLAARNLADGWTR